MLTRSKTRALAAATKPLRRSEPLEAKPLRRSERLRQKARINYAETEADTDETGAEGTTSPLQIEISIPFTTLMSDQGVIKKMRLSCIVDADDAAAAFQHLSVEEPEMPQEQTPTDVLYHLVAAIANQRLGANPYDIIVAISKHISEHPNTVSEAFRPHLLHLVHLLKDAFLAEYTTIEPERRGNIAAALSHLLGL